MMFSPYLGKVLADLGKHRPHPNPDLQHAIEAERCRRAAGRGKSSFLQRILRSYGGL